MKIIISPAKKMNINTDDILSTTTPIYSAKSQEILSKLNTMNYDELKSLWRCNDKIASENVARLDNMDIPQGLTPALLSYDGIQYKYMAPTIFEDKMLSYVSKHLRILSGFYGILSPLDGVVPYRLEMQADLSVGDSKNLYNYWGDALYEGLSLKNNHPLSDGNPSYNYILNLASKEYSKAIEKYLQPSDHMVTCVFGELKGDKVVQQATYAKMARGEMVRYMAENDITDLEHIKSFDRLGFTFSSERSDDHIYTFLRNTL